MDWDNDGIIDLGTKEEGYSDPWYKALVTCWLDDWYYKYNRDYDGDRMIGGYDQVDGGFRAFNDGLEYVDQNLTIPGYTQDLDDPLFNPSGCNGGLCSQSGYYYNGYNWFTDLNFLDQADEFNDLNSDGIWNPAEPFYDEGSGFVQIQSMPGGNFSDLNSNNQWDVGEPFYDDQGNMIFEGYSLDIEDYNHMLIGNSQGNNQYWIYYNSSPGAMVLVETDGQDIVAINPGDKVYNEGESFVDWNGDASHTSAEPWVDINQNGGFDRGYSKNNQNGKKEVGSKDDYSFSDELKELIANVGLEYWYTDNFVLRAGYIHDREGKIMNPTFGAGIKFGQYAFDFGYTAGDEGHARANTMFFSISMDLTPIEL